MVDTLLKWILGFHSCKVWVSKLKSKETIRVYLPNFNVFCDTVNKNPEELVQMKMEGQKAVGTDKEFQLEELHDITISEMETTPHVKNKRARVFFPLWDFLTVSLPFSMSHYCP